MPGAFFQRARYRTAGTLPRTEIKSTSFSLVFDAPRKQNADLAPVKRFETRYSFRLLCVRRGFGVTTRHSKERSDHGVWSIQENNGEKVRRAFETARHSFATLGCLRDAGNDAEEKHARRKKTLKTPGPNHDKKEKRLASRRPNKRAVRQSRWNVNNAASVTRPLAVPSSGRGVNSVSGRREQTTLGGINKNAGAWERVILKLHGNSWLT